MKIGVITFCETMENYGQLAQACALQIYLEEKGHSPFLIKYDKSHEVKSRKPGFTQKMKQINWSKLLDPNALISKIENMTKGVAPLPDRKFEEFKDDFLKFDRHSYTRCSELQLNPPEADLYITGSDQVWNHQYTGDPKPFFLQFGSANAKRASYAASFGHKELPESIMNEYEQYLRSFNAIGVREKSGLELCRQMGYGDASLLPDPTLLISKEKWMEYSQPIDAFRKDAKKKILVYTLGNRSSELKDQTLKYLKQDSEKDLSVVHVSINKDTDGDTFPTIPQWFDLFNQADMVITNSFHGTLFSIIFRKNFLSIPSSGTKAGMNERLFTVLEKFNLFDHLLTEFSPEYINLMMDQTIDWTGVEAEIEEWKRVADRFIDRLIYPTVSTQSQLA
ncbi:MAG: polysaccharide pyruvyl transferase family protein [Marinoscillum sp.]